MAKPDVRKIEPASFKKPTRRCKKSANARDGAFGRRGTPAPLHTVDNGPRYRGALRPDPRHCVGDSSRRFREYPTVLSRARCQRGASALGSPGVQRRSGRALGMGTAHNAHHLWRGFAHSRRVVVPNILQLPFHGRKRGSGRIPWCRDPRWVNHAAVAYGNDSKFRTGVTALGLIYAVGVQSSMTVWEPSTQPLPPKPWTGQGRPPKLLRRDDQSKPISVKQLATELLSSAWNPVRKQAHLLIRGAYDSPGKSGARRAGGLPPLPAGAPNDRLGLASGWSTGNPLTARVTVNRFWQNYSAGDGEDGGGFRLAGRMAVESGTAGLAGDRIRGPAGT